MLRLATQPCSKLHEFASTIAFVTDGRISQGVDFAVAINSYVELEADGDPASNVFDGSIVVRAVPSRVEVRTAWLIHGLADLPGYIPFARLTLVHGEPGHASMMTAEPRIYHASLERLDGSTVLFLAYTVELTSTGAHRIGFPRAEVSDITVTVQTAG